MAKDNTVLILGALGVTYFLFRKQINEFADSASGFLGSVGSAGSDILRESAEVFQSGGNFLERTFEAGERVVTQLAGTAITAGDVVQLGLEKIPNAVAFPFRFGNQIGKFAQDIFFNKNQTVGGSLINEKIAAIDTRVAAPIREFFSSAAVNIKNFITRQVSTESQTNQESNAPEIVNTSLKPSSSSSSSGGRSFSRSSRRTPTAREIRENRSISLVGRLLPSNPFAGLF